MHCFIAKLATNLRVNQTENPSKTFMSKYIQQPTRIQAAGNKPKEIEEFIGFVNSGNTDLSIARMKSPQGWAEPGQRPEFDEFSIVLRGTLCIRTKDGVFEIKESQAFHAQAGEWLQYSTPYEGGAEYIAVCKPAFSPDSVNRDSD